MTALAMSEPAGHAAWQRLSYASCGMWLSSRYPTVVLGERHTLDAVAV